jgi:hypothetical protein
MQNLLPRRTGTLSAVLLALAVVLPGLALARDDGTDPYYDWRDEVGRGEFSYDDSQDIPWIENETEILAAPKTENLHRVRLDTLPQGFELFVDRSRITVDPKDRVVRLWLWVRSQAGNESGSFEGFRCATREYKVYAYANPRRDPPVTKASKPRWREVKEARSGNYRAELLADYFCGIRGTWTAQQISENLSGMFERERFLSQ